VDKYFSIEAHDLRVRLWPPPTLVQLERQRLQKTAGWLSIDCGYVRQGESADAAISCATHALKSRKAFQVSFDFIGMDTTGVIGIAGNRNGEVFEVRTEELGHAALRGITTSGASRSVSVIRCEKSPIELSLYDTDRYLLCPDQ
jgi:hypothetical protein